MQRRSRQQGNTLVEFGLILAVIAMGSIVVFQTMQQSLERLYTETADSLSAATRPADLGLVASRGNPQQASPSNPPSQAPPSEPAPEEFGQPSSRQVPAGLQGVLQGYEKVCFTSGKCVDVPVIPPAGVQTTGTNGGELTAQFANVMTQLAQALEESPDGDSHLAGLIRDTANAGHDLGVKQGSKPPDFNSTYDYNYQLTLNEFNTRYQKVDQYIKQNPGSLEPASKTLLTLEKAQIHKISDGYILSTSGVAGIPTDSPHHGGTFHSSYGNTGLLLKPTAEISSKLTHQSANVICGTSRKRGCIR